MLDLPGYEIDRAPPLHRSPRSVLYRARRLSDGRRVVLKTSPEEVPSRHRLAQIRREFDMTRRVAGHGVVEVLDLLRAGSRLALVVDDPGGVSLSQRVANGPLPVLDALTVGAQVARALARVHRAAVIHKDVNPSNVLVGADLAVWLIDFDVSTELPRETTELVGAAVIEGTLAYMSPEQTGRMNRALDWRTDLYALGVTLFEMLTGQRPFAALDPAELVHQHLARPAPRAHAVNPAVPGVVSDLVARLLAKNPEDRYQSAAAVADDLERALNALREKGIAEPFELGRTDRLDRFQIPQKLYGRDDERARLLGAFARAAEGGRTLLLVAGYSGIGKSALVHEVQRPIVEARGHLISGKFDQLARNVPYASLIQAFREMTRQLLTEPAEVLAEYRARILDAVAPNGRVITEVIPEVELIVGPQDPVAPLSPAEAQNRFNLVFESFVRVFATAAHPLTLFLDDLQWADLPSLSLVSRFMTDTNTSHMLLVGAYRDNEVDAAHPLMLTVDRMRATGADIETVAVPPLRPAHVEALVADALRCTTEECRPVAALAFEKTGGNPFFLGQFLLSLHDAGAITWDDADRRWRWDLGLIAAQGITDNVVDLMSRRLRALRPETQRALRNAAAVGNTFDLRTLAIVLERDALDAAAQLAEGLAEGFVLPVGTSYKFIDARLDADGERVSAAPEAVSYRFLHDRVQQAAYALVPASERPALHLAIALRLRESLGADELHDRLFELLGHAALCAELITNPLQRKDFALLAAEAGRRAKASAAYRPSLEYLQLALSLLGDGVWEEGYEHALELHLHLTEAAYLTGDLALMERYAALVDARALRLVDRARAAEVRVQAYIGENRLTEAIDTALGVLAELGVSFPAAPSAADIGAAIGETAAAVAGRDADALYALPEVTDPEKLAAIRLLTRITSASYVARPALFPLVPMKGVVLSVTYGNTAASTYAYACYGIILAGVVGDVPGANSVGDLAVRLVDRFNAKEFEARTRYIVACYVRHWSRSSLETWEKFLPIFRTGLETGDLEFSGWSLMMGFFHGLFSGRSLDETADEAERATAAITRVQQKTALGYVLAGHSAVRALQGLTPDPLRLDDPERRYDAAAARAEHQSAGDAFGVANALLWEEILAVLFDDVDAAERAAAALEPWLPSMVSTIHVPMQALVDTLWRLRRAEGSEGDVREALLQRAEAQRAQLARWAEFAPMNHRAKSLMAAAEIARVRGDFDAARRALREAVNAARESANLWEEALACELTARLWAAQSEPESARAWYARAHQGYAVWGARAKAAQLDARYNVAPHATSRSLRPTTTEAATTTVTTGEHGEMLDLSSVLKASQALSREVELDALVLRMLEIVLENGGADGGALLLPEGDELTLVARIVGGRASAESSRPTLAQVIAQGDLPGAVLHYVTRTREVVVLDDACTDLKYRTDPYVTARRPRAVLCMPLVNQGAVAGVLYLENSLAAGAFNASRLGTLELLAGQMSISLANARLFSQTRALERANARFVPYQFLSALERTNITEVQLGDSVRKEISVFFSDIRGFTRIIERMRPEETLSFVNDYLAVAEPAIHDAGGFVDTYLGDGIMALFDRGADSAVRGGIAMHRALGRYNADRRARGLEAVRTGMGINTGTVTLGILGGPNALKCGVVGDPVNLAARIEGLTKRYGAGMLISENTFRGLAEPGAYGIRRVGRVQVVGKLAPVTIYEVIDGDPESLRAQKAATIELMEAALTHYYARRPEDALELFKRAMSAAPDDVVPQLFVTACRALVSDGVPPEWDGIERLSEK
jgi:predicted ATPase/tRNA A-37 threonylcarbamoyl transferase component Bud32